MIESLKERIRLEFGPERAQQISIFLQDPMRRTPELMDIFGVVNENSCTKQIEILEECLVVFEIAERYLRNSIREEQEATANYCAFIRKTLRAFIVSEYERSILN